MQSHWPVFIIALVSYLIGSFPTGVVLSRRKYGIDVREMGSGNIGATNVTRVFGWYAGFIVFLADFLKGALALLIIKHNGPDHPWLLPLSAIALVLGHCFSLYLGFRGGKGVATSLGCLAVVIPWGALIAAVTYVVFLAWTKISAVGSLSGILALLIYTAIVPPSLPHLILILGISAVVVFRHTSNIQRLFDDAKARRAKRVASR